MTQPVTKSHFLFLQILKLEAVSSCLGFLVIRLLRRFDLDKLLGSFFDLPESNGELLFPSLNNFFFEFPKVFFEASVNGVEPC